jgi:hypothetical protein
MNSKAIGAMRSAGYRKRDIMRIELWLIRTYLRHPISRSRRTARREIG